MMPLITLVTRIQSLRPIRRRGKIVRPYLIFIFIFQIIFCKKLEKSAAALQLKLESICMSKDLTSKMHLKMKLYTHKLQEGGSVSNHLWVFREIVTDLQSMEVTL
jgi:hypothetical protein